MSEIVQECLEDTKLGLSGHLVRMGEKRKVNLYWRPIGKSSRRRLRQTLTDQYKLF